MRGLSFLPAKRLILSYVWDWICIIAIAAVGAAFNYNTPYRRPFSLVDLSIQYPYIAKENIPTWLLVVVGLVAPAAIIFVVSLVLVPGPTISRNTPRSLVWRRKLWEWNTGWMGLALSLAIAFMFTMGMKNLFGKPRPDLLDRCQPDLSEDSIARSRLGGYSSSFSQEWVLVSAAICQQADKKILDEGFRSFPSGHASFSWSGLLYLAFFLASKFAISIPFLPNKEIPHEHISGLDSYTGRPHNVLPTHKADLGSTDTGKESEDTAGAPPSADIPSRNQAAAPPVYLLALPLVPICTAIYITSTRYFQFFHHGFDLLFGSFIGITSAWFAFRWYHLPINQGAGWAWGARSTDRAFAIGVGVPGYVGLEGWQSKNRSMSKRQAPQDTVAGPGYQGSFEQTGDHRTATQV